MVLVAGTVFILSIDKENIDDGGESKKDTQTQKPKPSIKVGF